MDLAMASWHKSQTRQRRRTRQRLVPDPSLARQASLAETLIKPQAHYSASHHLLPISASPCLQLMVPLLAGQLQRLSLGAGKTDHSLDMDLLQDPVQLGFQLGVAQFPPPLRPADERLPK